MRRVEIVPEQVRRHHLGWLVGKPSGSETRNRGKLKWAASQEAVTFPWLSAHSILKRIGGDGFIVDLPVGLSRTTSRSRDGTRRATLPSAAALTLSSPEC